MVINSLIAAKGLIEDHLGSNRQYWKYGYIHRTVHLSIPFSRTPFKFLF